MKTLTKEIWMDIPQRRAVVSIHNEIERLVKESGVKDGFALVEQPSAGFGNLGRFKQSQHNVILQGLARYACLLRRHSYRY